MESREQLSPWMPWCHPGYTIADTRTFIDAQIAAFSAGTEYTFAIVDPSGALLGCCGLNHIDRLNRMANLGYWVRTSAAGRGVASEAGRQLVQWAFAHTDFNRLEIMAAIGNVASQRAAQSIGGVREGVLRSRLFLWGRSHDAVMFSVTRDGAPSEPLAQPPAGAQ